MCKCVCECVCDKAAFFFQGVPDLGVVIEGNPNIFLILVEVLSYVHARMHTHTPPPHHTYSIVCSSMHWSRECVKKFLYTVNTFINSTEQEGRCCGALDMEGGNCGAEK